jgi:hypothetical protein
MLIKTINSMLIGWIVLCVPLDADAKNLTLSAEPSVPEGLLDYIMPRFTLKTRIRFERVDSGGDLRFRAGPDASAPAVFDVINGPSIFLVASPEFEDRSEVTAFRDWLRSEPGRAALTDFRMNDEAAVIPAAMQEVVAAPVTIIGDAETGRALSLSHCRRCHKVDRADKYSGLDNSPSFHAMRSFEDWFIRFSRFYAVSPHKALIIVEGSGITKDPSLISMQPIRLSVAEVNDIVAFVYGLEPLDLGQPIQANP